MRENDMLLWSMKSKKQVYNMDKEEINWKLKLNDKIMCYGSCIIKLQSLITIQVYFQ